MYKKDKNANTTKCYNDDKQVSEWRVEDIKPC